MTSVFLVNGCRPSRYAPCRRIGPFVSGGGIRVNLVGQTGIAEYPTIYITLDIMIGKLRNLGKHSQEMLAVAGIETEGQLRKKGAAAAFVAVKHAGCTPSLNLLWAIEGALTNRDWKEVAKNDRLSLLTQVEILEKEQP